MHFTGTTVLKVINGKIVEEIGLDDGVTALTQLGLIKAAWSKQSATHRLQWRHTLDRRMGSARPARASFALGDSSPLSFGTDPAFTRARPFLLAVTTIIRIA